MPPSDPGDRGAVGHRVADADLDLDPRVACGGELHEPREVDRRDDLGRAAVDNDARLRGSFQIEPGRGRLVACDLPVHVVDHLAAAVANEVEDIREVHLAERPVEEQQEEEDACEEEPERAGLGEDQPFIGVPPDDREGAQRVDERRAEHAERVPRERCLAEPLHQPERVRGVPGLGDEQADREDDAGERDHPRRDRAEELLGSGHVERLHARDGSMSVDVRERRDEGERAEDVEARDDPAVLAQPAGEAHLRHG